MIESKRPGGRRGQINTAITRQEQYYRRLDLGEVYNK
jgi:hypothetical protein